MSGDLLSECGKGLNCLDLLYLLVISRGSGLILVCPCIRIRLSWVDKTSVLPLFQ